MHRAEHDVLQRGHLAEQLHVLEGARDAGGGDVRWRQANQRLAREFHRAGGRHIDAGQHVHHGALAGPVRADQAVDGAALDGQVHLVQRLQAAELHQSGLPVSAARRVEKNRLRTKPTMPSGR
ncbi:hypothetical protein G6F50_017071 [Rhizopus delemar]|uniref:Uncharacterized protein n=1 Tax=Rhizopus delemar TaxID=936053 RepID=A0A9P6XR16_9FUNG|nr:hypothetical protein G6F50_017071 [Rhizopus delemar]